MKLTKFDKPFTRYGEPLGSAMQSKTHLTKEERSRFGKRITPEIGERIRYLVEERCWSAPMVAGDVGFFRNAVQRYCRKHGIKRPAKLSQKRSQSLRLTWDYMARQINPHQMALATGYNHMQCISDYKLLRSLSRKERRAAFNFEEDLSNNTVEAKRDETVSRPCAFDP